MPEDREPNAPDMPHADTRTPLHGPTGGVPSDKALSDTEFARMRTYSSKTLWGKRNEGPTGNLRSERHSEDDN
eukprot:scaffold6010_cov121-Isochrysis_galbana.AAC.1